MMTSTQNEIWFAAAKEGDFPANGGSCVQYKEHQIAVFNFTSKNQWYATQNLCPHKQQMILSRGMIGDSCDEPKVACPYHKKTFSLVTGENMNGEEYKIKTFPVKVEKGTVFIDVSSLEA